MPDIKKTAIVTHTPAEMFKLVNDIEAYPAFIPWCRAAQVLSRNEDEIRAMLTFARSGIEKSFTTSNRLQPNKMIELSLVDGPFRHLRGFWQFDNLADNTCQVSLDLEFEFSNKLLGLAFGPVFTQVANALVDAFHKRADEIYGI